MKPKVVLIPGFMGSVLVNRELALHQHKQALELCRKHVPRLARRVIFPAWLEGRDDLCSDDSDPAVVWGTLDMLHWLFDPDDWFEQLTQGNGYDDPGDIRTSTGITRGIRGTLAISGRGHIGPKQRDIDMRPYQSILARLQRGLTGRASEPADVRVFPYDWRLSIEHNARLLEQQINAWWWPGHTLTNVQPAHKVTLIGHSLGGLIARYYVENRRLSGVRYVRQLIAVGTPHLGSPEIFTHLIGATWAFEFANALTRIVEQLPGVDDENAPTHLMPKSMQTRLLSRFASALEMVPIYPFASTSPGKDWASADKEPVIVTQRRLPFHSGTGQSARNLIKSFRDGLIPPGHLGCYLENTGIQYHLLAATGIETIVGVRIDEHDRRDSVPVRSTEGDGTVPVMSATMSPWADQRAQITVTRFTSTEIGNANSDESYDHQALMNVPQVQDYCVNAVHAEIRTRRRYVTVTLPQIAHASALLDLISADEPSRNKYVVSVIRLKLKDHQYAPVLTYELQTRNGKTYVLGIPGTRSDDPAPAISDRRYVYVTAYQASDYGGVLFLPQPCQPWVELITWSVGEQSPERMACSNDSHAEKQFSVWLSAQDPPWRSRIASIEITNRSTTRTKRSVSPCKACCSLLAGVLRNDLSQNPSASLAWRVPFEGRNPKCGATLDTTAESLQDLTVAGWTFV